MPASPPSTTAFPVLSPGDTWGFRRHLKALVPGHQSRMKFIPTFSQNIKTLSWIFSESQKVHLSRLTFFFGITMSLMKWSSFLKSKSKQPYAASQWLFLFYYGGGGLRFSYSRHKCFRIHGYSIAEKSGIPLRYKDAPFLMQSIKKLSVTVCALNSLQ